MQGNFEFLKRVFFMSLVPFAWLHASVNLVWFWLQCKGVGLKLIFVDQIWVQSFKLEAQPFTSRYSSCIFAFDDLYFVDLVVIGLFCVSLG